MQLQPPSLLDFQQAVRLLATVPSLALGGVGNNALDRSLKLQWPIGEELGVAFAGALLPLAPLLSSVSLLGACLTSSQIGALGRVLGNITHSLGFDFHHHQLRQAPSLAVWGLPLASLPLLRVLSLRFPPIPEQWRTIMHPIDLVPVLASLQAACQAAERSLELQLLRSELTAEQAASLASELVRMAWV